MIKVIVPAPADGIRRHLRSRVPENWRPRTVASWALLSLAVAVSVIGAPAPTAWARLFFVLAMLGGLIAAAGLAGQTAQLLAALSVLSLLVVQRVVVRPVAAPPPSQWTRTLQGPHQVIRHTMDLPVGRPEWNRLWQRAAGAAVHVCARGPLAEEDGLQLHVNDVYLGTITQVRAFGPRPLPTSIGFYRTPVSRQLLERQQPSTFVLRRAAGATDRPIEICGTFSHRPTAGIESSAFFDGTTWWSPGPSQQGRFLIELRIEDAELRALEALY